MLNFARKLLNRANNPAERAFLVDRPLVVLQSDDWGCLGVRDHEGYELLRDSGIRLGQHPYDFRTLETAEDVLALQDMLKRHHDSTGRSACLVMNFLTVNLDFEKITRGGLRGIHLRTLDEGLPGKWKRPRLFDAYHQGVADQVFYPALHGLTHFCRLRVEHALARNEERRQLLQTLWMAETPYIYWRMPWVGYEYNNPEKPRAGFLPIETQEALIHEAVQGFTKFFSGPPTSACAPGYRANHDTHLAWSGCGIRVAQNGSGTTLPPHMDDCEILNLYRTIDFEPHQQVLPIEKYMQLARGCFARGVPAIVSVHSINFHSTLKDFRGPTLRALDAFLSALESEYPNLLYVHDGDLYEIVTRGKFRNSAGAISVRVTRQSTMGAAFQGEAPDKCPAPCC